MPLTKEQLDELERMWKAAKLNYTIASESHETWFLSCEDKEFLDTAYAAFPALLGMARELEVLKYKNPNPNCEYPFEPNQLGYCWSYASYIDGTFSKLDCTKCEFWKQLTHESEDGNEQGI